MAHRPEHPRGVPSVAAIVVTYNRRELLRDCLDALGGQTVAPDATFVIDNAGDDGSDAMVLEAYPWSTLVRLSENRGGAGGFALGIERAFDAGFDWIWVMDDDTIPRPTALAELLDAASRCPSETRILASSVVWTDGTPHPMNQLPRRPASDGIDMPADGIEPIRAGSFVSMLIHRDAVARFGLPYAEYFIWNDDLEFSARALRDGPGFAVERSVVEHRTRLPYMPNSAAGARFYYEVRNKIWMLRTRSWRAREKPMHLKDLAYNTREFLRNNNYDAESRRTVWRGVRDGLRRPPRRRFVD